MANLLIPNDTLIDNMRRCGVQLGWARSEYLVDYAPTDPRRTSTTGYRTNDAGDAIEEAKRMAAAPLMPVVNAVRLVAEIAELKTIIATLQGELGRAHALLLVMAGRLDVDREGESHV